MAYAEWSPYTVYVVGDRVNYISASYEALQTNVNILPSTLAPNWVLLSSGSGVQTIAAGNANITITGTATNPILSGTLVALTSNVATTNFSLSGNTGGNPSFVVGGTEEFKVITTDLTPHILVGSSGVQLGLPAGYGAYEVVAPTVAAATTSDTQVATTAFVQSAITSVGNNLSQTLINGNSAGSTAIDMNSQNITAVNNLTVASPYNFSVVSIYADATARDAALPTPYAGQMAFLTGSNKLQFWNTNWTNVSVLINTPIISGFTITTQYEIIYVNASNTVINAPTLGGFTIVRFFPTTTTSGTITLPETTSVEYLVVGGGGGGAGGGFTAYNGGGGGGGGLLTATDNMIASTSYAVSVGQGGTAGAGGANGGNGANSSLVVDSGTITATGGGGGGAGVAGLSGGSGGGGGWQTVVIAGGAGTVGQGNTGGSSTTSPAYAYSGGGGGSSAVGSSANGQGGAGTSSTIVGGSALFYAGGGGGGASTGVDIGANTLPTGGSGVGGNGGYKSGPAVAPTAGTNGRGGGGGGRGNWTSSAGAAGGSGVVIVRFPSYS